MKTKSLILSLGMIVALFWGLVSCTKTEEVEAPSLSLDKKELQFAKEAGEMAVTVTTNQETWVATTPAQWLTVEMAANKLTVKAKANTLAEARTSYVMVNAGGATPQVVKVTQVAADINLKLLPEVVEIPQQGGAFTVDVQSNDPEWKVELEEEMDWIEIRPNLVANFISLVVKANETAGPREAKLLARSSNLKKTVEVVVKQAGRKVFGEYTLPLLQKTVPTTVELIEYEEMQGNRFNRLYPKGPFSGPEDVYTFFPRKHFAERAYSVGNKNILSKVEDVSLDDQIIKSPYIDFLIEKGFEKVTSSATVWQGLNKEIEFTVTVTAYPKSGTAVTFERVVKQTESFPTWDKLPEETFFKYLETGEKLEKIKADEEAAGSTNFQFNGVNSGKHVGQVRFMMCTLAEALRPHLNNAYFFDWADSTPDAKLGTLEEKVLIYDKVDLAFWTDKETEKRYLTNEIKALLAKEGWRFQKTTGRGDFFYEKGKRVILFRALSFSDVNDGKLSLVINAYIQDAQDENTLKLRIYNRDKYDAMVKKNILRAENIFKFLK